MVLNWFKKKNDSQKAKTVTEKKISEQPEIGDAEKEGIEKGVFTATSESENRSPEQGALSPKNPEHFSQSENGECEPVASENTTGVFQRLKSGLSKTRKILSTDIDDLFSGSRKIDADLLEELEELLITADIGVQTSMDLIERISTHSSKISGPDQLKEALKSEILSSLHSDSPDADKITAKPYVIMVVGVNGVGKTTTIGKLAARATREGNKVLVAAADTFRAAATEQLVIWAERAGAEVVKHKAKTDPAAVAYDGVEAAIARGIDIVFVDTAGRIHTKYNLMEELKKVKRVISKRLPDAPHEILLVLDATTGQNALSQSKIFNDALGVTSIALTKLDGTAKGGIVVSIRHSLEIPLKYIGVGEKIEDLQEFNSTQFVNALFD
ncbi:signal recognition particle-docking protein FtsY [Thermodesulfobacteriota bacterium]